MVVSATRSAQPIGDVVADVTIIDRETIERAGPVGLADILARVPGIQITRNGGIGANTSVVCARRGKPPHPRLHRRRAGGVAGNGRRRLLEQYPDVADRPH
jgi:outer membrane receptor for Fe3+-dicitrate